MIATYKGFGRFRLEESETWDGLRLWELEGQAEHNPCLLVLARGDTIPDAVENMKAAVDDYWEKRRFDDR